MDAGAQKDMQIKRLATDYQRHLHIDRINIICIITFRNRIYLKDTFRPPEIFN